MQFHPFANIPKQYKPFHFMPFRNSRRTLTIEGLLDCYMTSCTTTIQHWQRVNPFLFKPPNPFNFDSFAVSRRQGYYLVDHGLHKGRRMAHNGITTLWQCILHGTLQQLRQQRRQTSRRRRPPPSVLHLPTMAKGDWTRTKLLTCQIRRRELKLLWFYEEAQNPWQLVYCSAPFDRLRLTNCPDNGFVFWSNVFSLLGDTIFRQMDMGLCGPARLICLVRGSRVGDVPFS